MDAGFVEWLLRRPVKVIGREQVHYPLGDPGKLAFRIRRNQLDTSPQKPFARIHRMLRQEQVYQRSPVWVQNALLNVHAFRIRRHRYDRPYRRMVGALLDQERWDRDRMEALQLRRLRHVVGCAYERSAYYRRVMDMAEVRPGDLRSLEAVRRLPLLTKEFVRSEGAALMTEHTPGRGWLHGHTSGTTGSPLGVWYDRDSCRVNNAVDWQHKIWAGMRDTDWIGLLLGRVIVPISTTTPPFWRVNRVQRQVWFSSFHLAERNLDHYVREMERRGLRFLEGYPSTLYVLARYLLDRGRTLPMQAVISSSETLHALQREAIEAAFQCRLFDFYALAERVIFAGQCEAGAGKHVAEGYGLTEVVDEDGMPVPFGESGYLVGTSLFNTAMPMIRYRTGDVSAFLTEPCPCGRTLRRIRDVSTKAEDIVVTPDGRQISPSVLTHPFKPLDTIVASQIVQDRVDHLLVRLVAGDDFRVEQEEALVASLRERLGAGMEIEVRHVPRIDREPSGKFRWVISRVEHSCALNWDDPTGGRPSATGIRGNPAPAEG
jgi:phenylacetate-CoA ligase